jgi:alkylation response protein AidB-like acyl-CoA dehydrogenase
MRRSPCSSYRPEAMSQLENTNDTVDAVRALVPQIAARCDEIERARRLPPDLVDALVAAGCFRSLVPRSHSGSELGLPGHMRLLGELAAADGSVGWTVLIGGSAPLVLGRLPRPTFDALYAAGPDVILAGSFNPTGVATPVDGGYRVTGQWSFASGCQHAHWFIAHCMVDDGRQPPLRMAVLPASEIQVEDTWWVSGLSGTGSHDFVVDDVFVPDDRTFSVVDGEAGIDGPLWRVPELSASTLMVGAVAVGIATAALDDIAALATGKVPAFSETTLAANTLFQNQFGEAEARLRAARSALYAEADTAWATATAALPLGDEALARIRATATWVTRTAASVVDDAYSAGGGSSFYTSSPLQRRFRDVHALTQHFAIKPDVFTLAGAVLLDQDTDRTFL